MFKWILIILFIALVVNGAVNFSTTEEFFSVNFHVEKTTQSLTMLKDYIVSFF